MKRLAAISRLTLGTAQLGMGYGVLNAAGDPGARGADAVLDAAWSAKITAFDTARAYGGAEARIGGWRARQKTEPVLISKLPPLPELDALGAIENAFEKSATALGTSTIDGYLCHRAADLGRPPVRRALEQLQAQGRITSFGVSVYSAAELHAAMDAAAIGIVQLPLSLANRRLADTDAIEAAAGRGILVFARSVYLQGILLAPPERLPSWLAGLAKPLRELHSLAAEAKLDVQSLALAAVNSIIGVHSIVIGAETPAQLLQTAAAARAPAPERALIEKAWSLFKDAPDHLTDPLQWPVR